MSDIPHPLRSRALTAALTLTLTVTLLYTACQVLEYKFPGHPAPPLGLLFKICTSVESWLDADEKNVAVVHCLTGKGRTAALMACILTWIGEFSSPMEGLQYVAERRGTYVRKNA